MRDKHHNSIALLLFIISASILFALTIYTSFMMESISTYLKDNIQERLLSVSRLAAAEISPEELEQLDSPDDVDTALFQEVRERLITFGEENNVVFVYYMRVNEDGLYQFIVDNDTTEESVNLASEPIEPEESPNLAQSGTAATSGLENYSIGYEGLLSAYAPIYDARGNVIAVAGVDISDEQILTVSKHTRNLIITLIISVVLVVISGLTNILLQVRRQRRLRTNLKQQRLMSEISQSFISDTPMTALIEDALHRTGEFLKVDRCLIVTVNKDTDTERPIYLWTSLQHGQTSAPNASFREALHTMFPSTAPETKAVAPFFCNDTDSENSGENSQRAVFDEAGLKAFIISPLYVEGTLWGILSIESRTKKRQWSDSDAQLVTTLSSAIAGAVARDLIEKERAAALERAVLASQAKGDFLSNMSHEMRTPMNAIIGMSSIGASSTELARKDYCFGRINDASSHLLGIINDVLDISKIEANRLELSYVSFSIEKMVEKVVSVIGFRVDEQQQELRVTLDDDVPHDIVTDDQRLAQVVTNLLSNAVKFTPEGGAIELNIHLLGEEDGLFTLQFEVSDTGIGISPEQQERLFTSFEQADRSTSRRFGGTGLGLAISKRIVELMGGTIWIESELGRGATFKFTIKTRRGKGEEHRYLPADVNWDNVRILAVDDAEETRGYFEQIAERFGILCDTAADGEEALAQIARADDEAARAGAGGGGAGGGVGEADAGGAGGGAGDTDEAARGDDTGDTGDTGGADGADEATKTGNEQKYDVYFIDWNMPDMDGIELTRRVKARFDSEALVIMTSSVEWDEIKTEATDAGVDRFLQKPLSLSSIADCLNELFAASAIRQTEREAEQLPDLGSYRILLAEDMEVNREIVLALLEPTGLIIECAENGLEALQKYESDPARYALIFMDVQMPEMDGYEATQKIRALDTPKAKKVPIVAMTANVFREDVERCLNAGMNDHVGKPLDFPEVIAKLKKWLPAPLPSPSAPMEK